MSASLLPTDVVHEILVNVPDLATLSAAIRVCQKHHDAFKAHPKSIVRAVVENIIGPALPQAARSAQYAHQTESLGDSKVDSLPPESHYRDLDWVPTGRLATRLEQRAEAVRTLRNFYSQRHKDRRSETSVLDSEESLKFDRAMYRYWLYLDLLEWSAFWDEDEDEDDDVDDDEMDEREQKQVAAGLKTMMDGLSTDELLEVLNVGTFAEETLRWAYRGLPDVHSGLPRPELTQYMVMANPATLASMLDQGEVGYLTMCATWEPIRNVLKEVLVSRKIKEADLDERRSKAIVRSTVGAGDTCSRCGAVGGVELIGEPNIALLSGVLTPYERMALLPGLLPRNREETKLLLTHIMKSRNQKRIPEKDLFHELVDLEIGDDGDAVQEAHQWSKDGWYCLECMKDLYRERLLDWWRQAKVKSGAPVPEGCWYGYNCRTMTHRPAHALKLNHLCYPTRGDGPQPPQQQLTNQPN